MIFSPKSSFPPSLYIHIYIIYYSYLYNIPLRGFFLWGSKILGLFYPRTLTVPPGARSKFNGRIVFFVKLFQYIPNKTDINMRFWGGTKVPLTDLCGYPCLSRSYLFRESNRSYQLYSMTTSIFNSLSNRKFSLRGTLSVTT